MNMEFNKFEMLGGFGVVKQEEEVKEEIKPVKQRKPRTKKAEVKITHEMTHACFSNDEQMIEYAMQNPILAEKGEKIDVYDQLYFGLIRKEFQYVSSIDNLALLVDRLRRVMQYDLNESSLIVKHLNDRMEGVLVENIKIDRDIEFAFKHYMMTKEGEKEVIKIFGLKELIFAFPEYLTVSKTVFLPHCGDFKYRTIDGVQDSDLRNNDVFNKFRGFKAKTLEKPTKDHEGVQMILNHIKTQWCSGNEESYKWILSWFKSIYFDPAKKTEKALILISRLQGIGKGIVLNFMIKYVFGSYHSVKVDNFDSITGNFNAINDNMIFVFVDELTSTNENAKHLWDRFKSLVTEDSKVSNQKNVKAKVVSDYCNYSLTSNHPDSVPVEQDQRRNVFPDCQNVIPPYQYFIDFSRTCENKETADEFVTFLRDYEAINIRDQRNIPKTQTMTSARENSKTQIECFIDDIKSGDFEVITRKAGETRGSESLASSIATAKNPSVEVIIPELVIHYDKYIVKNDLFDLYLKWIDKTKNKFTLTNAKFFQSMYKYGLSSDETKKKINEKQTRVVDIKFMETEHFQVSR